MSSLEYKTSLTERVTNIFVKGLTAAICRVDYDQLARVPSQGPLIIVTNHINFLEAPVIYTRLPDRPVTAFAKVESWDSAFIGWLFDIWGIIPIKRGVADKAALKRGLKELKEGGILTIAPEGTRSHDGRLGRGFPGVVMMSLHSGAPMLPIVSYGHEDYKQNLRKLRRSDYHIVVGEPFKLKKGAEKVTSEVRQKMTDEIMYRLAALLPSAYRGEYAELPKATEHYIDFSP